MKTVSVQTLVTTKSDFPEGTILGGWQVAILPSNGGPPAAVREISDTENKDLATPVTFDGIPPGNYTVRVVRLDESSNTAPGTSPVTAAFTVEDDGGSGEVTVSGSIPLSVSATVV